MSKRKSFVITLMMSAALLAPGLSAAKEKVGITPTMGHAKIKHNGKTVKIMRNQDQKNVVNPAFAKTSRKCPPFCIQPIKLAPGVETIAEVEMIDYLQKMSSGDNTILVVDSRTPDWVARGTIPGAKNIPWTKLNAQKSDVFTISDILKKEFGAKESDGVWDFRGAKTLVMFCNGMWCGQSPNNIKSLLQVGYPAHKIKWYRGGMQNWEILGLTTVKP